MSVCLLLYYELTILGQAVRVAGLSRACQCSVAGHCGSGRLMRSSNRKSVGLLGNRNRKRRQWEEEDEEELPVVKRGKTADVTLCRKMETWLMTRHSQVTKIRVCRLERQLLCYVLVLAGHWSNDAVTFLAVVLKLAPTRSSFYLMRYQEIPDKVSHWTRVEEELLLPV